MDRNIFRACSASLGFSRILSSRATIVSETITSGYINPMNIFVFLNDTIPNFFGFSLRSEEHIFFWAFVLLVNCLWKGGGNDQEFKSLMNYRYRFLEDLSSLWGLGSQYNLIASYLVWKDHGIFDRKMPTKEELEIRSYWQFAAICQFVQLFMYAFGVEFIDSTVVVRSYRNWNNT
jgi:hypothetical protein